MWIHVDKETKMIKGYTEFCEGVPIPEEGCDVIEVDELPDTENYIYSKYEDNNVVLDSIYKAAKLLEDKMNEIRFQREVECFPIINRGFFWYNTLNDEQKEELNDWYKAYLDAPATLVIPTKPLWLK